LQAERNREVEQENVKCFSVAKLAGKGPSGWLGLFVGPLPLSFLPGEQLEYTHEWSSVG